MKSAALTHRHSSWRFERGPELLGSFALGELIRRLENLGDDLVACAVLPPLERAQA